MVAVPCLKRVHHFSEKKSVGASLYSLQKKQDELSCWLIKAHQNKLRGGTTCICAVEVNDSELSMQ